MKILVTGGAGFIGSHTVDALLQKGHSVRILDNLQKPVHFKGKPSWVPQDAEFILGDVRNKSDWQNALKGMDAVFHFAAYQDYLLDFSTFFHVNAVGTSLLYEVAIEQKLNLRKVIVASSQFVQGEGLYHCQHCSKITRPALRSAQQLKEGQWEQLCLKCHNPIQWQWTNEDAVSPPNAYAMAKYSQELQAINFGQRYQIPSVALRYSIVQGPRQSFYNSYSGACRIFALSYYFGKAPTIYEDGHQCRDFVNIHDVVQANLMALENEQLQYNVFNVGGSEAYTIVQFDEIVRREIQNRKKERLPQAQISGFYRFGDTRNACSDISKLKFLGWKPKFTPIDSVREYVDWLYAQNNIEDTLDYAQKQMKSLNVVQRAA